MSGRSTEHTIFLALLMIGLFDQTLFHSPAAQSTHVLLYVHLTTLVISVIYGCITNHPKLEWLKTRFIFIGLHFAFKEFGQGSMGIAYLCSHVLIARFKLHLAGGYTMAIGLKWLHSHVWDYGAGCWLSCPVFFFFFFHTASLSSWSLIPQDLYVQEESLNFFTWQLRVGREQELKLPGSELAQQCFHHILLVQTNHQVISDSGRQGRYMLPLDGRNYLWPSLQVIKSTYLPSLNLCQCTSNGKKQYFLGGGGAEVTKQRLLFDL